MDFTTALASVDTDVLLESFYAVVPIILTIAVPILGAKIGLGFLFGMARGI